MATRLPLTLLCFVFCSITSLKAQCDLHPIIKPDNLILCPNTFDTIYVTNEYDSYQWFRFNKAIPGATQRYLVVNAQEDAGALFKVQVTKNGCVDTSKKVLVDGYAFAGPVVITEGTSSYFDVQNQISVFCKKDPPTLTFPNPYNTNVQWYNNSKPIPGANSQTYQVTGNGSYTVTGAPDVCPNYIVCQCVPVNIAIDNFNSAITRSNDTLKASKGASYQWYANGNAIPGATKAFYLPTQTGLYSVEITDKYNCSDRAKPVVFTATRNMIVISPNPADNYITVQVNVADAVSATITDAYGNRRLQTMINSPNQNIQLDNLNTGTYVLHVLDKKGNMIASQKFMKK